MLSVPAKGWPGTMNRSHTLELTPERYNTIWDRIGISQVDNSQINIEWGKQGVNINLLDSA